MFMIQPTLTLPSPSVRERGVHIPRPRRGRGQGEGAARARIGSRGDAVKKRWSLSVPMEGFSLAELGDIAREAEALGYTDAWSFEVDGVDGFTPLAVIAPPPSPIRLGIPIANFYTRGPPPP